MEVGGLLREIVNATVYVGIHVEVLVAHGIEHLKGFLRCRRVVEVHQWMPIHLAREYGEVGAYFLYVVHLFMRDLA